MSKPIFIICGKSGVGKTTLIQELCKLYNLQTAESYTTRPKRTCDKENHIFVSEENFKLIPQKLLSFTFAGYYYCITYSQFFSADLFGLPPNAIMDLYRKKHFLSRPIRLIYVDISDEIRYERMINRNDNPEWILIRMLEEEKYFSNIRSYADKIVYNDDLKRCLGEIKEYIYYER